MHTPLKITFILLMMLAITSPPFVFTYMDYIGRESRAFFIIMSVFLLFIIRVDFYRMRLSEIYVIYLAISLFCFEIVLMKSKLNNIVSYYAVIFLIMVLHQALIKNELASQIFLRLWISFAYFMSFAVFLTFIIHQFTSFDTDFLNFSSFISNKEADISIFGATQDKQFSGITLARAYSYFFESSYAGIYFSFNIIIANNIKRFGIYNSFYFISILAGLLTFSAAFYLVLLTILFFGLKSRGFKIFLIPLIPLISILFCFFIFSPLLVIHFVETSVLNNTSLTDRLITVNYGIDILRNASLSEIFLGHGVAISTETTINYSSGIMNLLVERGFLGLLLVLSLLVIYSNKNRTLILTCIMLILVTAWYKNYIFWFGIILAGLTYLDLSRRYQLNHK